MRIQDQPLHILALLLSRPGEIVTREELRRTLWADDTFVDFDHSLNSAVKRLRDTLHDDPDHPRLIETIPRHGYRFIAPVVDTTMSASHAELDVRGCQPHQPIVAGVSQPSARRKQRTPGYASVGAVVLVLFVAATAVFLHTRAPARVAQPVSKVSIAVLPLHDLSESQGANSLSAGMTQEIITCMGRLDRQRVAILSGASLEQRLGHSGKAASKSEPVADYLLEGSTRVQGNDVRVAVQLVKADDLSLAWAESYDRSLGDTLAIQRDIAEAVARAISERLGLPNRVAEK